MAAEWPSGITAWALAPGLWGRFDVCQQTAVADQKAAAGAQPISNGQWSTHGIWGPTDGTAWPTDGSQWSDATLRWSGGGGNKARRKGGGGLRSPLSRPPPPFRAHVTRYPNTSRLKMIPHDALIILRYVLWRTFFFEVLPTRFAAQVMMRHQESF